MTAKINPDIIIIVKGNPDKSTGQEVKTMEEYSMTATEAARLIDWLTAHGHTAEDATDCIKHIATGTQQGK